MDQTRKWKSKELEELHKYFQARLKRAIETESHLLDATFLLESSAGKFCGRNHTIVALNSQQGELYHVLSTIETAETEWQW